MYLKRVYVGPNIDDYHYDYDFPRRSPFNCRVKLCRHTFFLNDSLQVGRKDYRLVQPHWVGSQIPHIREKKWKVKGWYNELHPLTEMIYESRVGGTQKDLSIEYCLRGKMPWNKMSFIEGLEMMGSGANHLAGLIDISLRLCDKRKKFVWIKPETSLHPLLAENIIPTLAHIIYVYGQIRHDVKKPRFNEYLTDSNEEIRHIAFFLHKEFNHG